MKVGKYGQGDQMTPEEYRARKRQIADGAVDMKPHPIHACTSMRYTLERGKKLLHRVMIKDGFISADVNHDRVSISVKANSDANKFLDNKTETQFNSVRATKDYKVPLNIYIWR